MTNKLLLTLTLLSALGSALIGGIFFAFSTFVMKALANLPAGQGIVAMKSINLTVLNPLFLSVFLGTALGCVILTVSSVLTWQKPGTAFLIAGSALYLFGTVVVTAACNVPRNEALATLDPASAESAGQWTQYVASWTAWNHVRTVAALAASAVFMMALWLSSARGALE
jgi:uncharacterized membrane protein